MNLLVYITAPDKETAERLAYELVCGEMAAGANVIGPALSFYRWQGNVKKKEEWLILAQSSEISFEALRDFVATSHPYAVPCVIGMELDFGHKPFLDWIERNSGGNQCK